MTDTRCLMYILPFDFSANHKRYYHPSSTADKMESWTVVQGPGDSRRSECLLSLFRTRNLVSGVNFLTKKLLSAY